LVAAEAISQLVDNLQNTNHSLTNALEDITNDGLIVIAVAAGITALVILSVGIAKTTRDYNQEKSAAGFTAT
jgi:hypothetical protein